MEMGLVVVAQPASTISEHAAANGRKRRRLSLMDQSLCVNSK
jgi:hypothetical protein